MSLTSHAKEFLHTCYGDPVTQVDAPHAALMHRLPRDVGDLEQWRISVGRPAWVSWTLFVSRPPQPLHSQRLLLSPDGCWPQYISTEAMRVCAQQGVTLAWFNRLEIAHDSPNGLRQGAFYDQFPASASGCLGVWAWGLTVTTGILRSLYPQMKIGAIGHSRGGKTALIAAVLDAQIDAVISHNSGTGGVASLAISGKGSESLSQLAAQFPHWLGAQALEATAQERLIEIDCMAVWSQIAPRPMLILQAHDDAWANPQGTRHAYTVLATDWQHKGEAQSLQLIERDGGHAMQSIDWLNAALFMRKDHWPEISGKHADGDRKIKSTNDPQRM
jgi:hypothetical protein